MPFRTRRSTRLVLLALVSAGGLLVAGAGAAQAKSKPKVASSPQTSAICTLSADLSFSPGITMAPGSGPMTSGGSTGSMSCSGKAKGAPITGPGTLGIPVSGTCLLSPLTELRIVGPVTLAGP